MIEEIVVKIERTEKAKNIPLPSYIREGDAGIDLRSCEDIIIKKGERSSVSTGIKIAIPEGYVGLIKDRSGIAYNSGIHTLAGVIDSNYRGEVKVVLLNTGEKDFKIRSGERIAQLLILPIPRVLIVEGELDETVRGGEGFGSSGTV